jgi:hypothetical protein
MPRLLLQEMLEFVRPENLSATWSGFDLATFSRNKSLWDCRQEAVVNTIKVLWRYYADTADH